MVQVLNKAHSSPGLDMESKGVIEVHFLYTDQSKRCEPLPVHGSEPGDRE